MRSNPVFREGFEIYWLEHHALGPYFYLLSILAAIEFSTLLLPAFDPQIWTGAANLFKMASVSAMILVLYFGLKITNQEYVPWRFAPLRRRIREEGLAVGQVALGQLGLLALHAFLLLFVSFPLLLWAGAIARAPLSSVVVAFGLLLFYALVYGVWGLVSLSLWESRFESRQIFVRFFFLCFVFLSALVYLPVNPVAFALSYLEGREAAVLIHFVFHLALFATGLGFYIWSLKQKERSA